MVDKSRKTFSNVCSCLCIIGHERECWLLRDLRTDPPPPPPSPLATVLQFSPVLSSSASCRIVHNPLHQQRRETVPRVEIFVVLFYPRCIHPVFPLHLSGIDYCGDALVINVQHLHNELGTRFRTNVKSSKLE